ncbi:MAG: tetratricopeptide repeat protein [Lentimicrobiaceae bacterium]|jgi:tetratricopeptide (TPR) repeat protein|nr:tetratricopeptide repeat protein [Lentimicrobiaceae bacterium]
MKSLLCLFVILLSIYSFKPINAQSTLNSNNIDSVLRTIKEPEKKVDKIIEFLNNPENQYLKNADTFAIRAYHIAENSHYSEGKIDAMLFISNRDFRISNYKKAMELAQKSKQLSEDMSYGKGLAQSLSMIGTIYSELGDYDNSSRFFIKSLKLFENLHDQVGISHSLGNIGMGFCNQQDYKKALDYLNKALAIATKLNSPASIKRQFNNIAVVYGDIGKYDTAIVFLQKALEINIKLGDKIGQGRNLMNIGYDLMNKSQYNDALNYFEQAIILFTESGNLLHMAECYTNFGFCYELKGQTDLGIEYFKKALSLAEKGSYYRILYTVSRELDHLYALRNDTVNAYKYVVLEKISNDSLYAAQKQKLLSKLELQYTYEKKEFQRQLAQQTKNTVMLIIIFSLISGLVILGLIFSRHRLKSKFVVLEKEKIESELDIKNRELSVNLISLIKKNEMLAEISDKLLSFEQNEKGSETKEAINKISREIRNSTNDKMFNEFSMRFQEVHAGFYDKLLKSYPDLTQNELKLCAFLRLNMSTKDIAELTGQLPPTIDRARYRLRKKLGLPGSDTNLVIFLSQL